MEQAQEFRDGNSFFLRDDTTIFYPDKAEARGDSLAPDVSLLDVDTKDECHADLINAAAASTSGSIWYFLRKNSATVSKSWRSVASAFLCVGVIH